MNSRPQDLAQNIAHRTIGRSAEQAFVELAPGIRRQLLSHGPSLMLCRVAFASGVTGDLHQHPHSQLSLVESGRFRITLGEQVHDLGPGDSCLVEPNLLHAAHCLEAGVLVDVFNPAREDFLPGAGA